MDIGFFGRPKSYEIAKVHLNQSCPTVTLHYCSRDSDLASSMRIAVAEYFSAENGKTVSNLQHVIVPFAGVDHILPHLPSSVNVYRYQSSELVARVTQFAMMIVTYYFNHLDVYKASQLGKGWSPMETRSRSQYIVSVMGLGVLGSAVARELARNGFSVRGWSRTPKKLDFPLEQFCDNKSLSSFLKGSDLVIGLLPHTAQTHQILNKEKFDQLNSNTVIVNLGRGSLLNEDELLMSIDSNQLRGAWLDVTAREPLPATSKLWRHPKVVITPHIAGQITSEMYLRYLEEVIQDFIAGREPQYRVDRDLGY